MISRRNFLKTVGGLVSLVSFAGCRKNDHAHIGPLEVVFREEPHEEWENESLE